MVIQILLYLAISCFLTKQQIRAIHLIINELRFIRCVSLVTVSPVITHYARHSYAMAMRSSGKSIEIIQEALGHDSLKTTKVYLDSFDSELLANESDGLI